MKSKIFALLGLFFLISSCNNDDASNIISQRFVHKYGLDISKSEWNDREQNGKIITTYNNGVTITKTYKNGKLHGPATYTFPNSSTTHELLEYDDGVLVKNVFYEITGYPTQEILFENDNKKIITTWNSIGAPLSIEEYENELLISGKYFNAKNEIESCVVDKNGIKIKRDRDNNLMAKETISMGQVISRLTFYANGQLQSKSSFKDYKLDGLQETFSQDGSILTKTSWNVGKIDGSKSCYRNNQKYLEIDYLNGKKHGLEKEYDINNVLVREVQWKNGEKHGYSKSSYEDCIDVQWFWKGLSVDSKKFQSLEFRESLIAEMNGKKE